MSAHPVVEKIAVLPGAKHLRDDAGGAGRLRRERVEGLFADAQGLIRIGVTLDEALAIVRAAYKEAQA